jgi:hypothetical protein
VRVVPIEAVGIAAGDEAMMQIPERAEVMVAAHARNASASNVYSAADCIFMHAPAEAAEVGSGPKAADMGSGIHPAEMRAAAESSHVAASAKPAATRFRRGGEQTRRKQGRCKNRC